MSSINENKTLLTNEFGHAELANIGNGIEIVKLSHQHCNASISLYAGHVLSWQPKNQQAVFWLSDTAEYKEGKAIRGGIPLCWPWFGAHHKDPDNQHGNHGFARQSQWQLTSIDISADAVNLVLTLKGVNQHLLFPIAYEVVQTLSFGQSFTQVLTMKNNSDDSIEYTGAFHSYFRISHPENVRIDGLSPLHFDDKLTGNTQNKQPLINGVGPVDRVYHSANDSDKKMSIVDKQWHRTIDITTSNTAQWVFWNPGKAVADNMVDVHKGGENEYVCLEPANTQPQLIPAKSMVSISQRIDVMSW